MPTDPDRQAPPTSGGGALRERREWPSVPLASIGDAVIATGMGGNITFPNPVARASTGRPREGVGVGPRAAVFEIVDEETWRMAGPPAAWTSRRAGRRADESYDAGRGGRGPAKARSYLTPFRLLLIGGGPMPPVASPITPMAG